MEINITFPRDEFARLVAIVAACDSFVCHSDQRRCTGAGQGWELEAVAWIDCATLTAKPVCLDADPAYGEYIRLAARFPAHVEANQRVLNALEEWEE